MTWGLIVIVAILVSGTLYAQRKHYEFLAQKGTNETLGAIAKRLKELEDYKSRVDALTLRAGFTK